MEWITGIIYALAALIAVLLIGFTAFLWWVLHNYLGVVARIFEEKPIFIVPRGQPIPGSEEVRFHTDNALTLAGSYLRTPAKRRGVILFGPEFGSNRWSCAPYCEHLVAAGFDVFTFEFRNQGESDSQPDYEPLQWVTNHEVRDMQAAIAYLKQRPDSDPKGIGIFGVSRGGGAGVFAAAEDSWIRCVLTDGAFATCTTMIPYMQKWVKIYSIRLKMQRFLPRWFYVLIAWFALRYVAKQRGCIFPTMERAIGRISPRPLLMIHGGADTYIRTEQARELFDCAGNPKEFWVVESAKHNQALNVATDEYRQRTREFFNQYLTAGADSPEPRSKTTTAKQPIAVV